MKDNLPSAPPQASPHRALARVEATLIKLLKSPAEVDELARMASRPRELRVLRGCLSDAGLELAVHEGLRPEHFTNPDCQAVFAGLLRLRAKKRARRAA